MNLKNYYWLIGGIIGVFICLFIFLLAYLCGTSCRETQTDCLGCIIFIPFLPAVLLEVFAGSIPNILLRKILIFIIDFPLNLLIYFSIGALIGWIIQKKKSN